MKTDMAIKMEEYFRKIEPLEKESNQYSLPITLTFVHKDYAHEIKHKEKWDTYEVQAEFRVERGDIVHTPRAFTVPTNLEEVIVAKNLNKQQVIDMMADVCFAAKEAGFLYEKTRSDLTAYEILTKGIKNYPLTDEQLSALKEKYSEEEL